MTTRVYRWDDASAPVLDNAAGSLINLLDKCLVTGYGAKTAAGWAKEFTGTNKAAFRAATGNRFRMRVDDTDQNTARIAGYEVMTDVDTGTGKFPTEAQISGGVSMPKHWYYTGSTTGTGRSWILVATGTFFHLWVDVIPGSEYGEILSFGDFVSYKGSDAYNTVIRGQSYPTNSSESAGFGVSQYLTNATPGAYMARSYTQIGSSVAAAVTGDNTRQNSSRIGSGGMTYPAPVDGGLYLSPLFLSETPSGALRGMLPGMWQPLHPRPLAQNDTFSGTGTLAGKTFIAVNGASSSQAFLETSSTW